MGNIAINFPHLHYAPSTLAHLGARVRGSGTRYRVAAPTFPTAKLSAGPKEGCSGGGSAEVLGEGAGRPVLGSGGKGLAGGGAREDPDPRREERPPPAPQRSKMPVPFLPASSLCASTTPGFHGRGRERPLPRPRGVGGRARAALARGEG